MRHSLPLSLLLGLLVFGSAAQHLAGQDTPYNTQPPRAPGQDAQRQSATEPVVPLVTANFSDLTRASDPTFQLYVGSCLHLFERVLLNTRYDRRLDLAPVNDTLFQIERWWLPLAPPAITAAQACIDRLYLTPAAIPGYALNSVLHFAVATNTDSLAQAVVTRKLSSIGANPSWRAAFLDSLLDGLLTNVWLESGVVGGTHLTEAHIAMARQYTHQLEVMGPLALRLWLNARFRFASFGSGHHGFAVDDTALDTAFADIRYVLRMAQAIPESTIPIGDRPEVAAGLQATALEGMRLTFLKSLDRTDLLQFVKVRDSITRNTVPGMLGAIAPPLIADYWFGEPTGPAGSDTLPHGAPPLVPAPQKLSLLAFVDPNGGRAVTATGDMNTDALVRRLHARFPALQITLIAMTQGFYGNESLTEHPEREAALTYRFLRDSLHMPGMVGIVTGKYRPAAEGHALPEQPALLDAYHIDVRDLVGDQSASPGLLFLVTPDGWIAWRGEDEGKLVPLIQRFLTRMPTTR